MQIACPECISKGRDGKINIEKPGDAECPKCEAQVHTSGIIGRIIPEGLPTQLAINEDGDFALISGDATNRISIHQGLLQLTITIGEWRAVIPMSELRTGEDKFIVLKWQYIRPTN